MGFFSSFPGTQDGKADTPLALPKMTNAHIERMKNVLGIRELESMPAQAARAFQLASDPNSRTSDFIQIIESDEALSARIIRVANSVYYFRGTPAGDIDKAVNNIGLDELRCLLSATMLRSLVSGKHPVREHVWANSVATAILCRMLAPMVDSISPGEAFLAGLLHDVGKLVMIRRAGELYEKVYARVNVMPHGFVEAEEEIYELNHVEVGQWIAESWSFPPEIIRAICFHHSPWPREGSVIVRKLPLFVLVKIADTIAHAAGVGHPGYLRSFQKRQKEELPHALAILGISTVQGEEIIKNFELQFNDQFSLFQPDNL